MLVVVVPLQISTPGRNSYPPGYHLRKSALVTMPDLGRLLEHWRSTGNELICQFVPVEPVLGIGILRQSCIARDIHAPKTHGRRGTTATATGNGCYRWERHFRVALAGLVASRNREGLKILGAVQGGRERHTSSVAVVELRCLGSAAVKSSLAAGNSIHTRLASRVAVATKMPYSGDFFKPETLVIRQQYDANASLSNMLTVKGTVIELEFHHCRENGVKVESTSTCTSAYKVFHEYGPSAPSAIYMRITWH
eukprot:1385009-Rhodomonas_salina.2